MAVELAALVLGGCGAIQNAREGGRQVHPESLEAARASMQAAIAAAEQALAPAVFALEDGESDHTLGCELPGGQGGTSVLFGVRSAELTGDPRALIATVDGAWRAKGYQVTSATVGTVALEATAHLPDGGVVIFGVSPTPGNGEATLDGESGCVPSDRPGL